MNSFTFSSGYTLNRAEQLIVGVLSNGPVSVQQLLKLGVCKAHVYKCLNRLLLLKVVERIGHGLYKLVSGDFTSQLEASPAPIPPAAQSGVPAGSGVPAKWEGDLMELLNLLRQVISLLTSGLFTEKSTESPLPVDQKSTESPLRVDQKSTESGLPVYSEATNLNLNNILNKTKERKDLNFLFEGIDFENNLDHANDRGIFRKRFAEKNLSEDLIDRLTAAFLKRLPGFEPRVLFEVYAEAREQQKSGAIKYRWIHLANYVRDALQRNGFDYPKCRNNYAASIDKRVEQKKAAGQKESCGSPAVVVESASAVASGVLSGEKQVKSVPTSGVSSARKVVDPPSERSFCAPVEDRQKQGTLFYQDIVRTAKKFEQGEQTFEYPTPEQFEQVKRDCRPQPSQEEIRRMIEYFQNAEEIPVSRQTEREKVFPGVIPQSGVPAKCDTTECDTTEDFYRRRFPNLFGDTTPEVVVGGDTIAVAKVETAKIAVGGDTAFMKLARKIEAERQKQQTNDTFEFE